MELALGLVPMPTVRSECFAWSQAHGGQCHSRGVRVGGEGADKPSLETSLAGRLLWPCARQAIEKGA